MIRGILAAIIGTAAMTAASETERIISGRRASITPGLVLSSLLKKMGLPAPEGVSLKVAAVWVHWIYGTFLGILFWFLAGLLSIPVGISIAVFFLIVWGAESSVILPLFTSYGPFWTWGTVPVIKDIIFHAVYAAATGLAWQLIGKAAI